MDNINIKNNKKVFVLNERLNLTDFLSKINLDSTIVKEVFRSDYFTNDLINLK